MMSLRFPVGRPALCATVLTAILLASLPAGDRDVAVAQASQSKPALRTVIIPVQGMVCVVCAASVRQAIKSLDGVSRVEVDLAKKSARVTFAPERVSADRIVAAINNISGSFKAGTPKEVE
jgi:copper chaperone CopZ